MAVTFGDGIEIIEEGFLDCGATGKFIDQHYAKDKGLKTEPLDQPVKVYNVDGTLNKRGTICRLGYRDTWENLQGMIPCHRTRTTEDHSRIPLVDQDESNN